LRIGSGPFFFDAFGWAKQIPEAKQKRVVAAIINQQSNLETATRIRDIILEDSPISQERSVADDPT
jgi:hypothetical protein